MTSCCAPAAFFLMGIAALLCGCGSDLADETLVQVGDVAIGETDLREFEERLPDKLRPTEWNEQAMRSLLQSLVDRELMVREAQALGYDEDAELAGRLRRIYVQRLKEGLLADNLEAIAVEESQIEEAYRSDGWNRKWRVAHIATASREEAAEIISALRNGADFARLAEERSTAPDADHGGDVGRYLGPADLPAEMVAALMSLATGEVSEPLEGPRGFEVFKMLDQLEVPLADVRATVAERLQKQAAAQRHEEYLQQLERTFEVVYRPAAIAELARSAGSEVPAGQAQLDAPAVTYADQRAYTAGRAGNILVRKGLRGNALRDSAAVVSALRHWVLADTLLLLEAERRGQHEEDAFVEVMKRERRKLLVNQLRRKEVLDRVAVEDAELEEQYEKDKEEFQLPPAVAIIELLAATRREAAQLLRRAEAGDDLSELAKEHSVRPGADRSAGHYHLSEGEEQKWGKLFAVAWAAVEGELSGPHEVEGGFSIFRVEQRLPQRARTLAELTPVLRHRVKQVKNEVAFEEYITQLRERHADRVRWNDLRLAELVAERAN